MVNTSSCAPYMHVARSDAFLCLSIFDHLPLRSVSSAVLQCNSGKVVLRHNPRVSYKIVHVVPFISCSLISVSSYPLPARRQYEEDSCSWTQVSTSDWHFVHDCS